MSDRDIYANQNFGNRVGFGRKLALLVIDFVNGFNDVSVLGGGNIATAIDNTVDLLAVARRSGVPVVFSRIVYAPNARDAGVFATKLPALLNLLEDSPQSQIVAALRPAGEDHVICKTQASCFFDTGLAAWLTWRGIDTVIVSGCTTSGCVRATVVDGASHNFRMMVVRECVGDRAAGPHDANLFDMDQKYADVVSRQDVMFYLSRSDNP